MNHKAHVEGLHNPVKQAGDERLAVPDFQIAVSIVFLGHIDDVGRPALQFLLGPLQ